MRFDVSLEPTEAALITIREPGGAPAALAEVGVVTRGVRLALAAGGFANEYGSYDHPLQADKQGRIRLTLDQPAVPVVVAHPSGIADTTAAALAADPELILQRWGRLEGTFTKNGQPLAGVKLKLGAFVPHLDAMMSGFNAFRVETDAQGRFKFTQVPPGNLRLILMAPMSENSWRHESIGVAVVRAGETTTQDVALNTYRFAGEFQWPEGAQSTGDLYPRLILTKPLPMPGPSRCSPFNSTASRLQPGEAGALRTSRPGSMN